MARRPEEGAGGSHARSAKARLMWFRRRRQAQLDLSALDRLTELVGRIVALLPEQPAAQEPEALRAAVPDPAPARTPAPAPAPAPAVVQPEPATLLLVATPAGYRLVEPGGVAPARGDRVQLAEGSFRVLRRGPPPRPGDPRRCAFLEREEPPAEARTSDG